MPNVHMEKYHLVAIILCFVKSLTFKVTEQDVKLKVMSSPLNNQQINFPRKLPE